MALRHRILGAVALVVALAIASLAVALSYDADCGSPAALANDAKRMRAIVYRCYGSPDVLELEEISKPTPADNEVLVKVHAAALNPLDWHYMRGKPYIMRLSSGLGSPENPRMGVDFSGTVEAIGTNVTRFKPGDEVFGGRTGALAEYVTVNEDRVLALKPANVTLEQAASVAIAAITALQALRDEGQVQPGQKVLINGASGGVGTFAVQIAKTFGAEVTGVCSTRNLQLVRSIGADHVFDYTREDFAQSGQQYDLILDNVGNRSFSDLRRVLKDDGTLVIVGAFSHGPWIGPLIQTVKASLLAPFVSEEMGGLFLADLNQRDLELLGSLMQAGKVTPVIDRRYTLNEVPAAMSYLERGHARGKVVVMLE